MKIQNAQIAQRGVGNTKTPHRLRRWLVVTNNPLSTEITHVRAGCGAKRCMAQLEKGEEEGTMHIQMAIEWKDGKTFNAMKKLFPRSHIEAATNWKALTEYSDKNHTRVEELCRLGFPKAIRTINKLRPWQRALVEVIDKEIKEPNDRTIHWYWSKQGNVGKSALCKLLCKKMNAIKLSGKANDSKYRIAKHIEKDPCNGDDLICLFDYVRSLEQFVSYEALESIKDGHFASNKYDCEEVLINPPIIVVFANFEPDEDRLSKDRWHIINCDTH